jgi:hypothetical protein
MTTLGLEGSLAAGLPTVVYSSRVLMRAAAEPGPMHNFPFTFDRVILARGWPRVQGLYVEFALRGYVNGHPGQYELGGRWSASGQTLLITHRFFNPRIQ